MHCQAGPLVSCLSVKNVSVPKPVFDEATQEVWRPLKGWPAPSRFREGFSFTPDLNHAVRAGIAVAVVGPERLPIAARKPSGKVKRRPHFIKQAITVYTVMDGFAVADQW